jgi:hypothetical protein
MRTVTIWGFGWYATFCLQALPPLLRAPAPVGLGLAFKPLAPFFLGSSSLAMAVRLMAQTFLPFVCQAGLRIPTFRGKHTFAIRSKPCRLVQGLPGTG